MKKTSVIISWFATRDIDWVKNKEVGVITSPVVAMIKAMNSNMVIVSLMYNEYYTEKDRILFVETLKIMKKQGELKFKEIILNSYDQYIGDKYRTETTDDNRRYIDPWNYEHVYKFTKNVFSKLNFFYRDRIHWHIYIAVGTRIMSNILTLCGSEQQNFSFYHYYEIEYRAVKSHFPLSIKYDYIEEIQKVGVENWSSLPELKRIKFKDKNIKHLLKKAAKVAQTNVSVLITGESGTGKELFANYIKAASPRSKKPYITVNCGAIPEHLLESELFGHVKGAFTGALKDKKGLFEEADSGTVFLDEIGDLTLQHQVKLLRFLQNSEIMPIGGAKIIKVDVRVVTATNKNLLKMVKDGTFRQDLYYRICVGELYLPPLREREDIAFLSEFLLSNAAKQFNRKEVFKITSSGRDLLQKYHWLGNIRELDNVMKKIALWSETNIIEEEDIKQYLNNSLEEREPNVVSSDELLTSNTIASNIADLLIDNNIRLSIDDLKKDLIYQLNERCSAQAEAAKILMMTPQRFNSILKKYRR